MRGRRGVALMISLLVAIFIFVLALSLLALDSEQNQFNVQEERHMRAYFAAQSGLQFYTVQAENFTVATAVPGKIPAPNGSGYQENFQVTLESDGDVVSVGNVQDVNGKIMATVTLLSPGGDMTKIYEIQ